MLRPKKMRKVRLIVLKSHVGNLVKDLHKAGLVDIRNTKFDGLEEGRPLPGFDEISAELLKLRRMLSMMESVVGSAAQKEPELIDGQEAIEQSKNLGFDMKLEALSRQAAELGEGIKRLESEAVVIDRILHFKGVDFSKLKTRTLDYRVGEVQLSKIPHLSEALEKTPGHTGLITEPGYSVVLAVYQKSGEKDVDTVFADAGFADIELPADVTTPIAAIERVNSDNESKKRELAGINSEIAKISKDRIEKVRSLIRSLEVESDRAEIAQRFSSSKCIYIIEGWIIQEKMPELEKLVSNYQDVILEDVPFGHDETPPTVLDNPKIAGPLEFLTENYTLPNYHEIDPTLAYFIALPIIYGMIVGDFVYGLISLGLSIFMLNKFKDSYMMSNVSKIWLYSAFPTMLFGILFDEFGGMTHMGLANYIGGWFGVELLSAPLYSGFHRIENVLVLIGITALVGMIHLAAGFILGAINEWSHNKKHSIAKIAWIGVELSILLIILPSIGLIDPAMMTAGLVLLVISVILLALTEGIIGIVELPGLVGNILSYSRIAVIGIVGVILAEILNEFLIPMPEQGIMALVLFPIFAVLHVVNCFIAMFESLIQGGRLNIVEFKMKFMHGGGGVFTPFSLHSKKY
ncbi:MAG: V-type ATPase 116kDa subunit family protein [Candidatus Micrarchaeota archaeon]